MQIRMLFTDLLLVNVLTWPAVHTIEAD